MENGASSDGKDPSAFLGEIIGAPVTVKLNSGVVYKGEQSSSALFYLPFLPKSSLSPPVQEKSTTLMGDRRYIQTKNRNIKR